MLVSTPRFSFPSAAFLLWPMATAILLFFLLLLAVGDAAEGGGAEADALLLLKASLTNASALSSWSSGRNHCAPNSPWTGVVCEGGAVSYLRLANLGLSGRIDVDALTRLPSLRSISLDDNSFTGAIPSFSRLQALKSIYLTGNSFSGSIPDDFFAGASHLKKIWLSNNAFDGPIPTSLSKAINLMELHIEGNHFTGSIPNLPMRSLISFDVSNNQLSGPIPSSLTKFNASSFSGNAGLCGPPLATACPGSAAAAGDSAAGASAGSSGVAVGLVLVVVVVAGGAVAVAAKRQKDADFGTLGVVQPQMSIEEGERKGMEKASTEKKAPPQPEPGNGSFAGGERGGSTRRARKNRSSMKGAAGGGGSADLVVVNEAKGVFGLADLMKAAAEVMGNGGMGSAYKAVMANGAVVAVKRVREMNRVGKETFEVEMRQLGRLNHPNVLPPLAYHYRKEEKLLISEYIPKGSLLYILHGDRGTDNGALNWPTRLKIIQGIARGMAYLHAELNSIDVPHGNLKSGNVLLTNDFDPLIVDYGFIPLVNPSHASQSMFAYKSPEALLQRQVSPKSDVYCLGIIILELLSGKFPSQYLNNTKGGTDLVLWAGTVVREDVPASILDPCVTEGHKAEMPEMERMVRLGAELIAADPDSRPDMKDAAKRIEEVVAAADASRKQAAGVSSVSHTALVTGGAPRTGSMTERSRSTGDNNSFAIS